MKKMFMSESESEGSPMSRNILNSDDKPSMRRSKSTVTGNETFRIALDINKYEVHFKTSLKIKKISMAFHKYLISIHTPYQWEFIRKIELVKQNKNEKKKIKYLEGLIENYLKDTSVKCLNISGNERNKFFTEYKKLLTDNVQSEDIIKLINPIITTLMSNF